MSGRFPHPFMPLNAAFRTSCFLSTCLLALMVSLCAAFPAFGDIRVVNAQGEHRMGDRDTREDAIRLATEAAKRNALEQVATYLESVTVVSDMDVTRDEIRTYTAGLVIVLNQQISTTLDGDIVVIKADLLAQMDTDEVARAIATLRENEDARVQLAELKQENEQLQEELKVANQALGSAATPDQVQQAALKRKEILNRVQSNAMVSQAWTDWAVVLQSDETPMQAALASLLQTARDLYPANPHVTVAEKTMIGRRLPVPPQPPQPGSAQARMPRYEMVPSAGPDVVPRTLNEITYRAPAGSFHSSQGLDRKGE